MFGAAPPPQNELTRFHPRSPYAAAKVYAYWITVNYRESYGMFGCNGILFNHESPRRGETFVTRKITRALAAILAGRQRTLYLGNLDAKRDWGFAPDYVVCQWQILQQEKPDDFVIGTGETHSVREFVVEAFAYAGVELEWRGAGLEEQGVVRSLDAAPRAGRRRPQARRRGRPHRPALLPPRRGRPPARRPLEGQAPALLGAEARLPRAGALHDRRRPGGRRHHAARRGARDPRQARLRVDPQPEGDLGEQSDVPNSDRNLTWHPHQVTKQDRWLRNSHKSALVWLTGLSASGKSTLANALEQALFVRQINTFVLDGDNVRHGLNKDLGFSPEDRRENLRRVGEVARLLVDAGILTIAAFISPYVEERARIRSLFGEGEFIEAYVHCSIERLRAARPQGPLQEGAPRRAPRVHRHLGALRGARRRPSWCCRPTS